MRNEAIQGWRVRSRIETGCSVLHNVTIPEGALGTLTSDISMWTEGIDEQECHRFAEDADRIKEALKRDILPGQKENILKYKDYWEQTKVLRGEDLLASRVAFTVKWDGIYEREPQTLLCASYTPWLELVE